MLLQISYNLSLPVEFGSRNSPWLQNQQQTLGWSRNLPEPQWTFSGSYINNDGFRFNPEYYDTSRFSVAPRIDYDWDRGVTGGGIRLGYRFRRSADEQNELAQQNVDLIYDGNDGDAPVVN
ncbi:unnamed protein product [Adineta ricciae]|uniref:Uncharacterized protein n=1 Tax=Adineta ricciae TaxID=249248 RepID=A0A815KK37_ADIRI|nr:unnamed protein product [Adineta ricciae]CAF1514201.1 unnamed protein product [Adineta ricciae]